MALEVLNRERGLERLLLEGGGGSNGAFLRAGLIEGRTVRIRTPVMDLEGSRPPGLGYRVFKAQFRNRKESKTCQRVPIGTGEALRAPALNGKALRLIEAGEVRFQDGSEGMGEAQRQF